MQNEQELISEAKKNNADAFCELISPYTGQLLNYAFRMLKNHEDAEDALQEAYLKIYNSLNKFEGNSSFKTWIYRIVTNVCLDMLRKQKRNSTTTLSITDEDGEHELLLPDDTYMPERIAQKNAALDALQKALSSLNDEHRAIITLRDIDGFSYEEIADAMNISLGTVKSRISRARIRLKELLAKDKELFC